MSQPPQVCRIAWLCIYDVSEGRLTTLKRLVDGDGAEDHGRQLKKQRHNMKFESVRAFLENYFAPENGRCEKMPNPRFGKEEYRLPTWLTKAKIYEYYQKDCQETSRKYAITLVNCFGLYSESQSDMVEL